MPSSRIKLGIAIAGVIVLVAGVIVAVIVWRDRRRLARLTAEAPAEVLNVDVISHTSNSGVGNANGRRRRHRTTHETDITYRYAVGGGTIVGTTSKAGDVHQTFRVGRPAKVCYNPAQPEESEVFPPDHKCGS